MLDSFRMIWRAANSATTRVGTTPIQPVHDAPSPRTADKKMHDAVPMPTLHDPPKQKILQPLPRGAKMQGSPTSNRPSPTNTNASPRILTTPKRNRDFASEIIYEVPTASNPLPTGYIGTFRGTRFFAPDYNVNLCCANGLHRLSCGHWIASPSACGVNCHSPSFDAAPFTCPTCRDAVQDILTSQLTADEAARLHAIKERDAFLFVCCAVELVTRRACSLKGNVAEAVLCALKPEYGRGCEAAAGPLPERMPSIEQIMAEMQIAEEDKERAYSSKRQKRRKGPGTFVVPGVCGVKRQALFGEPVAKKRRVA